MQDDSLFKIQMQIELEIRINLQEVSLVLIVLGKCVIKIILATRIRSNWNMND